MTTTRERALEAALRQFWQAHESAYVSAMADDTERGPYDEAADAARAALALPPSPQPAPVAGGSWSFDSDDDGPDVTIWQGEDCVATAWNYEGGRQYDHARLIAAAPDMLAALQLSKRSWDDLRQWIAAACLNQSLDWGGLRSFMDAAQVHSGSHAAAIARATGAA